MTRWTANRGPSTAFADGTIEPCRPATAGLELKTTLDLDEQVLRRARGRAAQDGTTLTKFVEDALRARLAAAGGNAAPFRPRLETVTGDRPPNVDIAERDALYEVIDRT